MSAPRPGPIRRLRLAGALVASGLLVEVATLHGLDPLAFVAFLVLGGGLVGVGALVYLSSLLSS